MIIDKKVDNKKIVFLIEDDVFLLKAYQIKFAKEGVEVWTATDGREALKFFERQPPNVVLLDLMLPGLNGFEVLEAMRKNKRWENTPVIILTNLGQQQDVARARNLKVADYIIKANIRIDGVVEKARRYLK